MNFLQSFFHFALFSYRVQSLLFAFFVFLAACQPPADTHEHKADDGHTHDAPTPATHTHEGEENSNTLSITAEQFKTSGIVLGTLQARNLSGTIKVNGVLDVPPQNLVNISAVMGGFVRKTDLLQGMKVKKGQLLVVIENQEFIQIQQDYLETKARLEYAELEYKRQELLAKENANAAKIFQQVRADYQSLQAKHKALAKKLQTIGISTQQVETGEITNSVSIFSPAAGYVTEVNVNLGKYVTPTDVLFELVDTEHLHVELSVFEQDVALLKIGQKLHFFLAHEPQKERQATVYLINPKINADRTVRVHCHFDSPETDLLPNTYVKAIIDLGETAKPALPDEAIVHFENQDYVFAQQAIATNPTNSTNSKNTTNTTNSTASYQFLLVPIRKGVAEHGFTEVLLPQNIDPAKTQFVLKGALALLTTLKDSGEEEGHGH